MRILGGVVDTDARPRHVAIVLDGNRRWARRRGLSVADGHAAGFAKVPHVIGWAEGLGIEVLTLWMLSVENLERSPAEVAELFEIIDATLHAVDRAGIGRIRHLGDPELLPPFLREHLAEVQRTTAARTGPVINLAVAYSGRHEVVQAIRALATDDPSIRSLADLAARIDPDHLHAHVASSADPVDLILRTSGEHRSSGFLLWAAQDAYLCFQDTLWPDCTRDNLIAAIQESYSGAHRSAQEV